jgi:acyl-CoA thioesterase FadM
VSAGWLDTYRGTVHRWELDNVDHFTVAFYFTRFDDAALALRDALGLGPEALARAGRRCATESCHVRYRRELRAGDLLHVRSGVIDVAEHGLVLAHELIDSGDGAVCSSVEQRVALRDGASGAPVSLGGAARAAAERHRVDWDGERWVPDGAPPADDAGCVEGARDTIKAWEVDADGLAPATALIHRYSAANGHLLNAFGFTSVYARAEQRGFSTFEFRLRVFDALRAGDPLVVRSGLTHVGGSSMRISHRLRHARTGAMVATLDQAGVHLDMVARRPAAMPEALRERARALLLTARP